MFPPATERLASQLSFLAETERLKQVLRRSTPMHAARLENTAEHSWTLALMAMVLAEYANEPIDLPRVLKMLLVHDLVEIDAGDTFFYDTVSALTKADRERTAANRIFGLLPPDQTQEFRSLWEEFEQRATPEAAFANTLDRLMPLMQNFHHRGGSWQAHGVTGDQVLERNVHMGSGSATLWEYAQALIEEAGRLRLFARKESGSDGQRP